MTPGSNPALTLGLCLAAAAFAPAHAEERPLESTAAETDAAPGHTLAFNDATVGTGVTATSALIGLEATEGEKPWYYSGYPWRGSPPTEPDRPGLKRDTAYFLGYQVVIVGALYLMPESVTSWDKEDLQNGDLFQQWWDNVNHPHWDSDALFLNYVAHPYWGATYYVRGRNRGLEKPQAFLYSALLSALYEYTLEAFAEPVSIQDLIVTPVLGSLLGEYCFEPVRARIRARPGRLSWSSKTVLFLTDPLGVLGSWTERKTGVRTQISVQQIAPTGTGSGNMYANCDLSPCDTLAARSARPWGLHVEFKW